MISRMCMLYFPSQVKGVSRMHLINSALNGPKLTTSAVHEFAGFLPWHRFFIQVYENALHDCGYTGTAMYWDWVADASAPSKASVFDPVIGFAGNGQDGSNNNGHPRVVDGPFKDYRLLYWNFGED